LTTFSDSDVVKPTPVNADLAWNLADSLDSPVWVRATVAIRVRRIEINKTMSRVIVGIMVDSFYLCWGQRTVANRPRSAHGL